MDARLAAHYNDTKRDLLSIIKAHRCQLHPQALNQLVRAACLIPTSRQDRHSFLQTCVINSALSRDRTIELRPVLEAISALIPTLLSSGVVSTAEVAEMQTLVMMSSSSGGGGGGAAGGGASSSSSSVENQQNNQNRQQQGGGGYFVSSSSSLVTTLRQHQANFRVVQIDDMPTIAVDEATCASFRVGQAPRASDLQRAATQAETARVLAAASGGVSGDGSGASTASSMASYLEQVFSRNAGAVTCPRTAAVRTRLALATSRVLRCPRFVATSFSRQNTHNQSGGVFGGGGGGGGAAETKFTVYRISALEGMRDGAPVTLVGVLRFMPWMISLQSNFADNNNNNNQQQSTSWILEDFTGRINLHLPIVFNNNNNNNVNQQDQNNKFVSNSFIGDGIVVVVHGHYVGAQIRVVHLSLPPGETRASTQATVGVADDFFGQRPNDVHAASRQFASADAQANVGILVSDVRISVAANAQKLVRLIAEFENRAAEMDLSKVTFVLVGDFVSYDEASSSASSSNQQQQQSNSNSSSSSLHLDASCIAQERVSLNIAETMQSLAGDVLQRSDAPTPATVLTEALRDLATMLQSVCPSAAALSEFILVPGPKDCCGSAPGVFPRAPLNAGAVAAFAEKCPRTAAAPNPCRLRFLTQEYVLCRAPLQKIFASSALESIEGISIVNNNNNNNNDQQQQQNQDDNSNQSANSNGIDAAIPSSATSSAAQRQQQQQVQERDNNNENSLLKDVTPTFAELAEVIVRDGFWFPVPSEGIAVPTSSSSSSGQNSASLPAAANASSLFGYGRQQQNHQQNHQTTTTTTTATTPSSAWGSLRWRLDRALYHGGAPHHPHVSLMCDDTGCWSCNVDDVACANPGSFSSSGVFAWISPSERSIDFNQL